MLDDKQLAQLAELASLRSEAGRQAARETIAARAMEPFRVGHTSYADAASSASPARM
jgi:hypothetical protein